MLSTKSIAMYKRNRMTIKTISTKFLVTLASTALHAFAILLLFFDLNSHNFSFDNTTSRQNIILNTPISQKISPQSQKSAIIFLQNTSKRLNTNKKEENIAQVKQSPLSLKSPINWNAPTKKLFDLKKVAAKVQKKIISQRSNVSLMDIARSFLAQDYIKKNGINNDHPSNEQIKRERYASKIKKCLYGSFNINKHKLSFDVPIKAPIKMYLEFLPNGLLKDVKLIEPTGIPELDSFALKICNDASKSFPPVPKFFGNTNCKAIAFLTLYPAQKKGHIEVKFL